VKKSVILVTGTPCVGKTVTGRLLASRLGGLYLNLTELAMEEGLIQGKDEKRGSFIVDEERMKRKLAELVEKSEKADIIIDGHYAPFVVSRSLVSCVFVLRRNPVELRKFMERKKFSEPKLWENLASEILDVCLYDAIKAYGKRKVCELDVTGKSIEAVVGEILETMHGLRKCRVGVVDWLGRLEQEGLLGEYLRI